MVFEGGNVDVNQDSNTSAAVPMIGKKDSFQQPENMPGTLVPQNIDHEIDALDETSVVMEESLSLAETEIQLIKKALSKHSGKRKRAAEELGISERTLYRKIKEYDLG